MIRLVLATLVAITLSGCTRNVNWVKDRADARWAELGFSDPAYEGYSWDFSCGGEVWYTLRRPDSPGFVYTGKLCKWGREIHFTGVHVISGPFLKR